MVPRTTIMDVSSIADRLGQLADTVDCRHVDIGGLRRYRDTLQAVAHRLRESDSVRLADECELLARTSSELEETGRERSCCLYRQPALHLAARLSAAAETVAGLGHRQDRSG